ncbi:class I glutamine amidotransferase-like protein [Thozetella sp. PMI_491]|nr:class I glutamine amidotransferase-like protein [Thozetella sp. PMI_491]
MSGTIDLKNPDRPIRVGVILMNGMTEILDVAPIDLLNGLGNTLIKDFPEALMPSHLKDQALPFEFIWVSENGEHPSQLTSGINIVPTHSFATCPPLDIVLIGAHNFGYTPNEAELAFVRKSYEDSTAFLTICGGVEVPLHAGLLQGKTATGPRATLPMMRQIAPTTNWVEKRWVRDGKLWSSGALLNGLDLMSAFATDTWGGEDTLVEHMIKLGSFPSRDVDYKDVPWAI